MAYHGSGGDWNGQGGGGGGYQSQGGYGGDYGGRKSYKQSIPVPSGSVGRVIGRGGSKIREIQEQSRCQIKVLQGEGAGQGQTCVEISYNTEQELEYATSLVRAVVEESDSGRFQSRGSGGGGGGGGQGGHMFKAPIPENCVGLIIGKGGARIKDIAYRVGCSVRVKNDDDGSHYAEVQGSEDQLKQVQDIISETVERQKMRVPY